MNAPAPNRRGFQEHEQALLDQAQARKIYNSVQEKQKIASMLGHSRIGGDLLRNLNNQLRDRILRNTSQTHVQAFNNN